MTAILELLAAIVLALNAWATLTALRSPLFENRQKGFQVVLIWLLPVFGALLVWHFSRDVPGTPPAGSDNPGGFDGDGLPGGYSETAAGDGGWGLGDGDSGGGDGGGD